jgi:hypothetical protein
MTNDLFTISHLGFYNRLIKQLLLLFYYKCNYEFVLMIASCKGHCGAMWHYGFATVVDIKT